MAENILAEQITRIAKKAESYQYSNSTLFSEEADNYGFSWTPSLETLLQQQNQKQQNVPSEKNQDYLTILQSDPVFHNPGSHQLMSECYGLEPYFSLQFGSCNNNENDNDDNDNNSKTWNYKSLQQDRNQHVSNQLTIDGIDLCRKGKYEESLKVLSYAIELFPTNVDALVALGACHANVGSLNEAILQLQTALLLNPNDQNALLYLERTKTQLEQQQQKRKQSTSSSSFSFQSQSEMKTTKSSSNNREEDGEGENIRETKEKQKSKKKKKKRKHSKEDDNESGSEDKSQNERKERKRKKKRKKSSKSKSYSPSSSSSSSHSSSPPAKKSSFIGKEEEEKEEEQQLHPILSRTKHRLWD